MGKKKGYGPSFSDSKEGNPGSLAYSEIGDLGSVLARLGSAKGRRLPHRLDEPGKELGRCRMSVFCRCFAGHDNATLLREQVAFPQKRKKG